MEELQRNKALNTEANSEEHTQNDSQSQSKKRKRKRTGRHNGSNSLVGNPPQGDQQRETKNKSNKKIKFEDDTGVESLVDVKPQIETETDDLKMKTSDMHDENMGTSGSQVEDKTEVTRTQNSFDESKSTKSKPRTTRIPKTVNFYSDDESDLDSNIMKSQSFVSLQERARELLKIRKNLPVYKVKDKITRYIMDNQVNVIIGETGSGKSTQIPQFLMPFNKKCIAVTQPRRVAASSLATRVSDEFGCRVGQDVGFSVRFQNVCTSRTKLKYLTDGMLLRELILDSKLNAYSTIVIDEAHERTILTDLIMGFLKGLLNIRKDLKLIIMSATLDAEKFSKFFNHCPILFIEGKTFPVENFFIKAPCEDIVDSIVRSVVQINMSEHQGDILCFLPGQEEIDKAVSVLSRISPGLPKEAPIVVPYPLYAALSPQQQSKIFEKMKARRRKVILATNIAETSVTIPGVKYVIDSGLRKVKVWRHQLGLATLLTAPISQASAKQRSGRAGREFPGKTFRLYSEADLLKLPKQTEAEIRRSDIIFPVLTLKKLDVDDILNWSWLEYPGEESIVAALNELYTLKALNDSGKITKLGIQMSVIPLPPQLSAVLISAYDFGCLSDCIDIASCLSVDNLILNPTSSKRDEINFARTNYCHLGTKFGDLICMKEYLNQFIDFKTPGERKNWCKDLEFSYKGFKNVLKIRDQLRSYMIRNFKDNEKDSLKKLQLRFDDDLEDLDDEQSARRSMQVPSILKAFLAGHIKNSAIGMPDRSYRTVGNGQLIAIHPSSVLFGQKLDAIMYIEYVFTSRGYARTVSSIELEWLQEIAPHVLGGKINIT